jgi:hypothetical protein
MPRVKIDHCVVTVTDWERSNAFYYAVRKKGDTTINPDRTVRGRVRRGAAARPSR